MRTLVLLGSCWLAVSACKARGPVGPAEGDVHRARLDRADQASVLWAYLDSLEHDSRARPVAVPCERHPRLAGRSVCVLDGFARELPKLDCNDGVGHLTARMVTRHFVCSPHGARESAAVYASVLGFLDAAGRLATGRCSDQRGWLLFSADVRSVLGTLRVVGVDDAEVTAVAKRWRVTIGDVTEAKVAEACALSGE